MKANTSVNKEELRNNYISKDGDFMRKGEIGNWKEHFSPELNEKMDKWIEKHLKGSDLKFTYEV